MKSLVRVDDATTEPVTLAEAQAFLRTDSDADTDLIETLITTARQIVEEATGRALISQTWQRVQSNWPGYLPANRRPYNSYDAPRYDALRYSTEDYDVIPLERSPLISVESLKYYPASGASQATLSSALYHVLTGPMPGAVVLKSTETWPDIFDRPDAIEVNFTAGYADAALVPRPLRHAVLLALSHLYDNRGAINIGNIVNELPMSLKFILEMNRIGGWVG